jgi:hypothetical protein
MYDFLLEPIEIETRDKVRKFIKERVPASLLKQMDQDEVQYPRQYVVDLASEGLLGLRFPTEWGGQGLGWTAEVAAEEEVGVLGMALGCLYSLPSICGEALNVFGNDDQKAAYLRPTLAGEKFCAEALTEPRGGSDFFGATTKAVEDGDGFLLTGQKRFVVGAEGADYFILYARTGDSSVPSKDAISLFIVDKDAGVETKYLYKLLGTRGGGAGRLILNNVRVPRENVIGNVGDGGKIFYQMMIPERMTSASGILGTARAALDVAAEYSTKRIQFGQHIMEFQGVSFKIADSITLLDAARALVNMAARAIDSGQPGSVCRRLVSEAKRFSTEKSWEIVNLAMQVVGGIGYTQIYPIEKLLRDARLSTIWTGTSEIMNLIIQHEFYKELGERMAKQDIRDVESDAFENEPDEKVYAPDE